MRIDRLIRCLLRKSPRQVQPKDQRDFIKGSILGFKKNDIDEIESSKRFLEHIDDARNESEAQKIIDGFRDWKDDWRASTCCPEQYKSLTNYKFQELSVAQISAWYNEYKKYKKAFMLS